MKKNDKGDEQYALSVTFFKCTFAIYEFKPFSYYLLQFKNDLK